MAFSFACRTSASACWTSAAFCFSSTSISGTHSSARSVPSWTFCPLPSYRGPSRVSPMSTYTFSTKPGILAYTAVCSNASMWPGCVMVWRTVLRWSFTRVTGCDAAGAPACGDAPAAAGSAGFVPQPAAPTNNTGAKSHAATPRDTDGQQSRFTVHLSFQGSADERLLRPGRDSEMSWLYFGLAVPFGRGFLAVKVSAVRVVRVERGGARRAAALHHGEHSGQHGQRAEGGGEQPADDGAAERGRLLPPFAEGQGQRH